MNNRTKEYIFAIHDHKPIYGNTNLTAFVEGMKAIEPNFMSRDTLLGRLDKYDFALFVSSLGLVYTICRYRNPNYKDPNRKK